MIVLTPYKWGLGLALAMVLSGSAFVASPAQAAKKAKILRVATGFGPMTTVPDPRARRNGWVSSKAGVSETLITLGYDMQLEPLLATKWENLSKTQWKITLREGVLFHDGTPMTAQSVVDSFAKFAEKGHPGHNPRMVQLLGIKDIKAVDKKTLVFTTLKPSAGFLWNLTARAAAVVKEGTKELPIIGTGPFVFVKAVIDKSYESRKFAKYWGGEPKLDGIKIDAIPDLNVAALALKAGDVDLVDTYPEPHFARMKKENKGQLFSGDTTRLFFFETRVSGGPLKHRSLREAISLALDRDTIVASALAGVGGRSAHTVFPNTMKSWANTDLKLPYDLNKAKGLLDKAGIVDKDGNGIREVDGKDIVLKVRTYQGRAALAPTMEISQAMIEKLGIKVKIAMGEWIANNKALKAGEIDMHLQAWGTAPQGDPEYYPSMLVATGGPSNYGGYSNPKLDDLLAKGREEFSMPKRIAIYKEVQEVINKDLPVIPIFHKTKLSVGSGKVVGYRVHPGETYLASPTLDLAN